LLARVAPADRTSGRGLAARYRKQTSVKPCQGDAQRQEKENGINKRVHGRRSSPEHAVLAGDSSGTWWSFSWSLGAPERRFFGGEEEERGAI
jgi:hypothetical protein